MKFFYSLALLLIVHYTSGAQTVQVSGKCISDTITLSQLADNVNGKVAYQGTGTVAGTAGVTVSVYWLGAPDNLWVLDFDGQPYFQNTCNFTGPPSSFNADCAWTAVTGTTCTGTGSLNIVGSGVLAVKLLNFTATKLNSQVLLNWETTTESGNRLFEVQRSSDGNSWQLIGSVPGNGQSGSAIQYRFTDKLPVNGKNYYRLLQKDNDGHSSYSAIITIDIINNSFFQVFGGASKGTYQLLINATQPAEISLLDLSGKKVWAMKAAKGLYQLDLKQHPAGLYMLQARMKDQVITQKLINP